MKRRLYTDININRVEKFLNKHLEDKPNLPSGFPPISSIELSINGACNRRCFLGTSSRGKNRTCHASSAGISHLSWAPQAVQVRSTCIFQGLRIRPTPLI